jgi:WD40 repeat protein
MSDRPGEYHVQQNRPFEYVVGGSLPLDAGSYVRRSADEAFFAGLRAGKFCYVLNSRQMGKSSLRVRTMARLQGEGVVCVAIDMTAIGSAEVTAEQWYLGVLWAIVKQVREQTQGLADWRLPVLRAWWVEREGLSFVQRWGEFLEVLLGEVRDRVVIFVDEIDSVLGLGFRADDFFAAIRECYNRRVDEPRYERLTFALLGVCAPSDLIQDRRRTPFNVGEAIELSGFTEQEAIGLAKGLPGGEETLRAVLAWTGGQPFLTQRVCRLVVEAGTDGVDGVVADRVIRVWESQDDQVHFRTIQDRMMADESIAGAVLGLYQRILAETGVGLDASQEQLALRLTGVAVKKGDRLEVANQIYRKVFDSQWVESKLGVLRPYGIALEKWTRTGLKLWLLQGNQLEQAQIWAEQKGRKLAPEDYHFLRASQDLSIGEKLKKDREARGILEVANKKAKRLIALGSIFFAASLMGLGGAALAWTMADIRILSMTVEDDYAGAKLQDALVNGMSAYQRFRPFTIAGWLNLKPYQVTEISVITALQTSTYAEVQSIGSLVDPTLKKDIRTAHKDAASSVVFSPDGNTIASASWDKTVKLWRRDGSFITTLKGHESPVYSVAFSPDGNTIASASRDRTVKLWRRDGSFITTLKGHESEVYSVVFSPDGNTIASASRDSTVKLWRWDGTLLTTLKGHGFPVNSVVFSPDGNTIASGGWDSTVKLWRRDGTLLTTLKGHESGVFSVAFSPDGNTIASGSWDKTVKLWRRDGTLLTTLNDHEDYVSAVAFSPDGNTIASASSDKTVKLWQRDGTLLTTLKGHESDVYSVAFSPDGNTIASGSGDETVKLWRRDGTILTTLNDHKEPISSMAFSFDGNTIVSGSWDKTVKLWRRDGTLLTTLKGHEGSVSSVAFSPDGNVIASASMDKTVKLWRRDGTLLTTLKSHGSEVDSVAFSPDGNTIASGSSDKTVKLWRRDGTFLMTLKGHESEVSSVAFSPDGNTIASASWDQTVKLWRRDGTLLTTLKGHEAPVDSVAFSPNSNTIASGSRDQTVKLWRRDGTLLTTLKGHESSVFSLAFSPDGNTIASGSGDQMVKLWRGDGTLLMTLKGHESSVSSLAFSPDGNTIASASLDATVKLWPIQSADLFAMGCYWLQTSHSLNASNLAGPCNEAAVQSAIPPLIQAQAQTHASNGNYSLAEALLRDIKTRNFNFNLPPALAAARKTASQSLLSEASNRLTTLSANPNLAKANSSMFAPLSQGSFGSIKPTAPNFDFLTQSYLEEANFLVRRAHSIDPNLNLNQELNQIKDEWKESVNQLKANSTDLKN